MKKISDVMNSKIITIEKETTFPEMINLMKVNHIGKLPVIENGELVGVVTREDMLLRKGVTPIQPVLAFWEVIIALPDHGEFDKKIKKISGYKASDIMSTDLNICKSNEILEDVITKMTEACISYFLVTDDNKSLVGILTKSDLINKCF